MSRMDAMYNQQVNIGTLHRNRERLNKLEYIWQAQTGGSGVKFGKGHASSALFPNVRSTESSPSVTFELGTMTKPFPDRL